MNVNLQAWFKKALTKERWKEPGWILQCFCVTELPNVNDVTVSAAEEPKPFDLYVDMNGKGYCYWDDTEREFIPLDGSDITEPLIKYTDKIVLNPGDLPNVTEVTATNYGNVIVNLYVCVYPFGGKVPFFTGKLKGDEIEKFIVSKAIKDPKNPKPDEILPSEITRYKMSTSVLATFAVICCATGSRETFTVNKEVINKRDELLKQHEHELTDPTVVADIEKQLVELDKKMMGPEADNFFGPSSKLRNIGRKRQEIIYGIEGGIDGKNNIIRNSLSEGMDFEGTPLAADTITAASQSRGLLTAQGGELVKYNLRMFQNAAITPHDCGAKRGMFIVIDPTNCDWLENRYAIVSGKTVLIDKAFIKANSNKQINLRSPGYCLEKERNFCKMCVDINLGERPDGIAIAAAAGTNVIMQNAMKAMHGRVNENFDLVFGNHIS